jgi:hypothetical protein
MGTRKHIAKPKPKKTVTIDSRRWCNGFACRNLLCIHHPSNIPERYRNTVFRYVDCSNFADCGRWEVVEALKKKGKSDGD